MTYQDFIHLCESRRSIRYFDDRPLKQQDILAVLEAGRLAPSVGNTQPWFFHVILQEDLRIKLMDTSCYGNFIAGAGAFIVVTCDINARPQSGEVLWNPRELEYSCMAAIDNILLAATALGLGSCVISLLHGDSHDMLGLPANQRIVAGIMLGHFRPGEEKSGTEHQRRALKDSYKFYE